MSNITITICSVEDGYDALLATNIGKELGGYGLNIIPVSITDDFNRNKKILDEAINQSIVFIPIISQTSLGSAGMAYAVRLAYYRFRFESNEQDQQYIPVLGSEIAQDKLWLVLQDIVIISSANFTPLPMDEAVKQVSARVMASQVVDHGMFNDDTFDGLVHQALKLESEGKKQSSLQVLRLLNQEYPFEEKGYLLLAKSLLGQSQFMQALMILDQAINLNYLSSLAWSMKSTALAQLGKIWFSYANKAIEQATNIDEVSAEALVWCGQTLQIMHQESEALNMLMRAVSNDASQWNAYITIAQIARDMGEVEKARMIYSQILDANAQQTEALWGLAQLNYATNHKAEALQQLKEVCNLAPENLHYWRFYAYALENTEQGEELISVLTHIFAQAPNDSDIQSRLGEALASIGKYKEASTLLESVPLDSLSAGKGWLFIALDGDTASTNMIRARQALRECRKHYPKVHDFMLGLGYAAYKLHETDEALNNFVSYLKYTKNPHIRLAISRIIAEIYHKTMHYKSEALIWKEIVEMAPDEIAAWQAYHQAATHAKMAKEVKFTKMKITELNKKLKSKRI